MGIQIGKRHNLSIGGSAGRWSSYWNTQNILQRLDFSIDTTEKLLLDVSGKNNNAKLVESSCPDEGATGNNANAVISTTLAADNLLFYDFSAEFSFTHYGASGHRGLIGRSKEGTFNYWLSMFFAHNTNNLVYISGDGSANTQVIMTALVAGTTYNVKASVSNSTGRIDWIINGITGGADFVNKTPSTEGAGESAIIGRMVTTTWQFYGKRWGFKYYSSVNYANLTHYWPMAEGCGNVFYDTVGTKHLTSDGNIVWGKQDELHYNLIKGFQLYVGTTANPIRVPYKVNGTKIDPVIAGYAKFQDCPTGSYHNFAETGIKRNYLNNADLTAVGVSNTNIIHYGCLSGSSGYGYCQRYMGFETNYVLHPVSADRKVKYGYPSYAQYIDDTVSNVVIVGTSGLCHSTNTKNALNRTVTATYYHVCFIRNGAYNLTNATTELPILIPEKCSIVGESRTGVVFTCRLAPDTAKLTIQNTPAFQHIWGASGSYKFANFTATVQNMRYVVHADDSLVDSIKRYINVHFEHKGNDEALIIDPTVWSTCDAIGSAFYSGNQIFADDSTLIGYTAGSVIGRGYATHGGLTPETGAAIHKFNNCVFNSNGEYSFRFASYPTGQDDKIEFRGCNFSGKKIYVDPSWTYDSNADKILLYKLSTDTSPVINAKQYIYIGLKVTTGLTKTLTLNTGAVKTLLFGVEKTINDYSITGRINITDWATLTGEIGLKGFLENCSVVNKVLSVKLDGVDTNITFNQDYSAMTNVQVLESINAINPDVQFSEYDFGVNAAFGDL